MMLVMLVVVGVIIILIMIMMMFANLEVQIAERVKHDVMAQHEKIGDFLVHVDPLDELHLVHDHAVPASYFKRLIL